MKPTSSSRLGILFALLLVTGCGAEASDRPEDLGVATDAFQVTNNGGRVISNVQLNVVFWGGSVDSTVTSQIPAFYSAVTNSPYMDRLSEYKTITQSVGRGSVTRVATITPAHNGSQLYYTDIEAELGSQIDQGILSPPNANSLYMVHLPSTVTILPTTGSPYGGGTSCTNWCGVHSMFMHNGQKVTYALLPDLGPSCAPSCLPAPTKFNNQTFAATHEMTEAITDPDFMQGWFDNNFMGNDNGGEIADYCFTDGPKPLPGTGYAVARTFSNVANGCGVEGPSGVVYTPGDFDGDGLTDLVVTTSTGSAWWFSNGDGSWNTTAYTRPDLPLGVATYTAGDFDGDGKTDLIITTPGGSYWYYSNWTKSGTSRSGGWNTQYWRSDLPMGVATFTPGDFDGDGKTDVILTYSTGSYWSFSVARGQFTTGHSDSSLKINTVAFTAADFDGDGKSDVIITTPSGSNFYFSEFTSGQGSLELFDADPSMPLGQVMFTPGNFSGSANHRSDLIVTTFYESVWWFSQYTPTTHATGDFWEPYWRYDLPLGTVQYTTANFDGDAKGTTDMLITDFSGSYWYMSKGDGSWYYPATWIPTLGNIVYTPGHYFNTQSGAVPNAANVLFTNQYASLWYYLLAPATSGNWSSAFYTLGLTL
jgi:hypothetical protein